LKILLSFLKFDQSKNEQHKINFKAGLTSKMLQEIQREDVLEISSRLAQKGIPTDFKNNKIVAWCCDKTIDILQKLNDRDYAASWRKALFPLILRRKYFC